jgi:hypothetical protein
VIGFLSKETTLNFVLNYERMQVILAQCSPRLMGDILWEKKNVLSGINGSKS